MMKFKTQLIANNRSTEKTHMKIKYGEQDKKAQKQMWPRLTTIVWRFGCRPFCKNNKYALIVAAAKLIALHLFFDTAPWFRSAETTPAR